MLLDDGERKGEGMATDRTLDMSADVAGQAGRRSGGMEDWIEERRPCKDL